MKLRTLIIAAASCIMMASPAWAQPLLFSYVGAGGAFNFTAPSNPTPEAPTEGIGFSLNQVDIESGGATKPSDVFFFSGDFIGGLEIFDLGVQASGPQIYSGTEAAPMFAPGVFALSSDGVALDGVLTVSDPAAISAAPEPSTWMLLLGSVGLVGAGLRRPTARRGMAAR